MGNLACFTRIFGHLDHHRHSIKKWDSCTYWICLFFHVNCSFIMLIITAKCIIEQNQIDFFSKLWWRLFFPFISFWHNREQTITAKSELSLNLCFWRNKVSNFRNTWLQLLQPLIWIHTENKHLVCLLTCQTLWTHPV